MKQNYLTENIERIVGIACTIFVLAFILALLSFIPVKAADTTYMPYDDDSELSDSADAIGAADADVILPMEPDPNNPYTPKPDPSEPNPSDVEENEPEGEYSISYNAINRDPTKDKTAKGYYMQNMAKLDSAYPIFLYLLQNPNNNDISETWYRTYCLGILLPTGECVRLDPKEHAEYVNVLEYMYASYYYSDDTQARRDMYEDVPLENKHTSFSVYNDTDYETDGYVFDSLESAQAYFGTGYTGGLLREPDGSVDFTPDTDNSVRGSFHLVDFRATSSVSATWSGLDVKHLSLNSAGELEDKGEYKNSFVNFEVGMSTVSNPGYVFKTYKIPGNYYVKHKKMSYNASSLIDSGTYILYLKATPYHYANDRIGSDLYRGTASYIYFDAKGNVSREDSDYEEETPGGNRRGTVKLNDFYLENVTVKEGFLSEINETVSGILAFGKCTIFWSGTTKDDELVFIPNSMTAVDAYPVAYQSNGERVIIGGHGAHTEIDNRSGGKSSKIQIDYKKVADDANTLGLKWNGDIELIPSYEKDNITYKGMTTTVNVYDKTVTRNSRNEDGSEKKEDVTPGSSGGDTNITVPTDLLSLVKDLLGGIASLATQFGQFGSFLAATFVFVPSYIWNIIRIGLIISVVTMVIKVFRS